MVKKTSVSNSTTCNNKSLLGKSECVISYEFLPAPLVFNFNYQKRNKKLSFKQIKNFGDTPLEEDSQG